MKLWLISHDHDDCSDRFNAAVVVAATEEGAKAIHPSGKDGWEVYSLAWAPKGSEHIKARYIGEASDDCAEGWVICSSYLAG